MENIGSANKAPPPTHAYKRVRQEAAYSVRRGKWRDVELLEFHELVSWLLTSRWQRCIRAPCHLNLPAGQIPSDFLHEIKKFSHSAIKSLAQTVCSLLAHSLVCLSWGAAPYRPFLYFPLRFTFWYDFIFYFVYSLLTSKAFFRFIFNVWVWYTISAYMAILRTSLIVLFIEKYWLAPTIKLYV